MKVLIKKQNDSQNIKPIYYGQHSFINGFPFFSSSLLPIIYNENE